MSPCLKEGGRREERRREHGKKKAHRMAAGRHHTMPLPPAAASGKIRFSMSSSVSSSANVFRGEKPSSLSGSGGGRDRDYGSGGGRGVRGSGGGGRGGGGGGGSGGGGGGGGERDRERSRSEGYSSKDLARDSSSNSISHHHIVSDSGREVIGRDGGRDAGRDSGRDADRDAGRDAGRDSWRDAGREAGRDSGRDGGRDGGRDAGRDHRSRNSSWDDFSARDLSKEGSGGGGGGYGKEKDRGDRIRDWEQADRGREKMGRERERDKKERDSGSSRPHQQQRRHVGGESGERDRALSPLFGRAPSAGGGSVSLSIPQNSVSPASDGMLDRDASGLGEARSLGARQAGKDAEREPGELPSGRRVEEISWRSDVSHSMSLQSRNARKQQPVETDGGGKRSPTKKRKFSPIVWDYDEKQGRPSIISSVSAASSASPISKSGGAQPPQVLPIQSPAVVQVLASPPSNEIISPPSKPPSSGLVTPPGSTGAHGLPLLSSSPQQSTPSPIVEDTILSLHFVQESNNETDSLEIQMQDQVLASSMSDDEPEPGQLLPDHDESPRRDSPTKVEEYEEENALPSITIAASRWAGETHTPVREKSPCAGKGKARNRSSSLESEEGLLSSGQDGGHVTSGPSTSPEPGEYIREKADAAPRSTERNNDSDGSIGQGSGGKDRRSSSIEGCKDRRSNSIEDEEYERELNKRELMELEEESDDDQEEQKPEVEPDFDGVPSVPSGPQLRVIDMLQGCRSVDEFEKLNRIDEGTYGVVYRARNKTTGEIVALKKVKMEKEKEGFPMTSLREINVLLSFHHPSVVNVKEVVVGNNIDSIFMVMEYMEHDLKGLMETMKQPFSQSEVKCLMLQLFEGVKYLHDNWVLHRDLKTSNLLLNNRGELKICDFGLARQYGSPLKAYTHMVVTLWYRAPELLLGSKNYQYSTAIDMWSLGCIMAEFLAKEPLFNGKSEIDQIDKIFKTLGTPNEKIWPEFVNLPGVKCNFVRQPYNRLKERFPPTAFSGRPALSESGFDLLNRLLTYDPRKRITADEALKHPWFHEVPLPKSKEFMPTFPARSEHDRRVRRLMKSPDPLEEQRKRELCQGELGGGGLFG